MSTPRIFVLLGALGLGVGALLPWVYAASGLVTVAKHGIEGDGLYTGAAGLLLLIVAIAVTGKPGRMYSWVVAVLGLLALVAMYVELSNINQYIAKAGDTVRASVGEGIYLSLAGAVLALIGGLVVVPAPPEAQARNVLIE